MALVERVRLEKRLLDGADGNTGCVRWLAVKK